MQNLPARIIPEGSERYDFEPDHINKFRLLFTSKKNKKWRKIIYYGIDLEDNEGIKTKCHTTVQIVDDKKHLKHKRKITLILANGDKYENMVTAAQANWAINFGWLPKKGYYDLSHLCGRRLCYRIEHIWCEIHQKNMDRRNCKIKLIKSVKSIIYDQYKIQTKQYKEVNGIAEDDKVDDQFEFDNIFDMFVSDPCTHNPKCIRCVGQSYGKHKGQEEI